MLTPCFFRFRFVFLCLRYHRRALTERRGEPGDELAYVDQVVEEDPKNYNAWSHRQWVLQVRRKARQFANGVVMLGSNISGARWLCFCRRPLIVFSVRHLGGLKTALRRATPPPPIFLFLRPPCVFRPSPVRLSQIESPARTALVPDTGCSNLGARLL